MRDLIFLLFHFRGYRLRGMEEEFYNYVDPEELASELKITTDLATTFHRFWILKRKVLNFIGFLSLSLDCNII